MSTLSAETTPKTVTNIAKLTETEGARLTSLKADLAADPLQAVRKLQTQKRKFDAGVNRIEQLIASVSDEKITALKAASHAFEAAKSAAKTASIDLFSGEPLTNIGGDIWRELWEAARTYSEASAYHDEAFPVTKEGAVCVLCLQKLGTEAAGRLNRFEVFIKDESKRREAMARTAYEKALSAMRQAAIPLSELSEFSAFVNDEMENPSCSDDLRQSSITALWRLRHVLRLHRMETNIPPMIALPDKIRVIDEDLQKRIAALSEDGASEGRKKLVMERDNLIDRAWLASVQSDVIAEIDRKKKIVLLQSFVQETKTNRITTKSAEITAGLVTIALRSRFSKEIESLGVAGLAIELSKERTSQGISLFRIRLISKPEAQVGEVLSEGEHRCVALAAFLAELTTSNGHSSIVFDDPVSSLDHRHREAVAYRLAKEGLRRQVIVFTHDIAFLFLIHEACRAQDTHIAFRSINRGAELAGFCHQNPPPNAQPVRKVIESMQKQLENQKIQHTRGNQEEWHRTVRSLQEQLRTTWERAVEEVLSPVIKRLANKVDTKGLPRLTILTIDDCQKMREAYGRCSKLLHSEAELLNTPLPEPSAIETEITALQSWVTDIQNRQDAVKIPY